MSEPSITQRLMGHLRTLLSEPSQRVGLGLSILLILGWLGFGERRDSFDDEWEVPTASEDFGLGTFEIESGTLVVSDPGFEWEPHYEGQRPFWTARKGTWRAQVTRRFFGSRHYRVGEVRVVHESVLDDKQLEWEDWPWAIGVDSGQVCLCDRAVFHNDTVIPKNQTYSFGQFKTQPAIPELLWYSYCCELTMASKDGSVMPGGVVTNAGWGDGGYAAYFVRDNAGVVIAFRVEFIDERGR